ncbi:RHS repeat-associated core domain-containing protein [Agarilytica rhodophyticola]|uniref:RHS repeat-associated core domain-containing protein n=1 Tax=Agarilytica rhodophyticola TaxID=1737490 RepID=UPI000B3438CA|nr:RHS repeat-associated core domain-containing protein [Agarilytica rhodophyticola]
MIGGGVTIIFDLPNQPTNISNSVNGNYIYDGNLKRVKSVVNGKTIYNIYDQSGALVHIDAVSDNQKTNYVSGPNGSLARISNNIITYLHPDHLGSAQSGSDENGNVIWREQYTPYGEEINSPAANDDLAGYTGHIKDSGTGLNYMQARYYDPVVGRFLSNDPVGFVQGRERHFNRYGYTYNDPVNSIDPDGEFALPAVAIGAIVGGVVNAVAYAVTSDFNGKTTTQILGGVVKAAAIGAVVGAATTYGAGAAVAAELGAVRTAANVTGAGFAAGGTGEIANQLIESGEVSNSGSVLAAAGGNAIGAGVGAKVAAPIANAASKTLSDAGSHGTGAAIKSLSSKVFKPVGYRAPTTIAAPEGAVKAGAELIGGSTGATTNQAIDKTRTK